MGKYVLNSPMIDIIMDCADVFLGVQWLQSLGTMDFNFQEFFMKFSWEGKLFKLRGVKGKPLKMETKMLKMDIKA